MSLNQIDIETLAAEYDWSENSCFTENFQKHSKPNEVCISIAQLKMAYENTSLLCDQFSIKPKRVEDLTNQIFKMDRWLKEDIKVVKETTHDDYYLIGGRHRLFAIVDVLCRIGDHLGLSNRILDQLVRVELLEVDDLEDIPDLVIANNESRSLTKAEINYIRTQKLRPGKDPRGYIETILKAGLTNKELIDSAAQYFVKKQRQLGDTTTFTIGKYLARYILFGRKQRIKEGAALQINTIDEFCNKADALWAYVEDLAASETQVARNASRFVDYAIDKSEKQSQGSR